MLVRAAWWHRLEHLNPVVRRIRHIDPPGFFVDDDPVQVTKLTIAGTFLAPHGHEVAVLVEHLHAVVADLGDVDMVMCIDGYPGGGLEFSRTRAGFPPRLDKLTVLVKNLDSVVLQIADVDLAFAVKYPTKSFLTQQC